MLLAALAGVSAGLLVTVLWPPRRHPVAAAGPRPSSAGHGAGGGGDGSSGARTAWLPGVLPSALSSRTARALPPIGRWSARRGARLRADASDLAVTGHDPDAVLAAKTVAAAATALVMITAAAVVLRSGVPVPVLVVIPVTVAATVGAYMLPDSVVGAAARRRRSDFLQALPVWCDLVALEMAGTAAPQEALVTAAEAGTTWPVQVLRDTLQRAVRARQSHWLALSELGERIGVPDLAELGRLSQLVSAEGAQVRDTFIERAAGMRRRALADSLGQAGQRDESMRLAVLVIAAGVILLMLFPGAIAVMHL